MKKTLGQMIREKRVEKELTLKDLASKVKKEAGTTITPQFLNDIEHDRRKPSEYVARQIGKALELDGDTLFLLAGSIPEDIVEIMTEDTAREFIQVFRRRKR